ncbi:MAG: PIN domain-containing protein [archaeon]|jgi:predicted nucleic acid-binding protein
MSRRVLVDTNIFLDNLLNRKSSYVPIGEFAFQFFKRTLECEFFVVMCIESFNELKSVLKISEGEMWVEVLSSLKDKNKIEIVKPSLEQKSKASRLSKEKGVSYVDALLFVIAKDNNLLLVTRDNHFFCRVECDRAFVQT